MAQKRVQVLVLGPPPVFLRFQRQFSQRFEILNPHEFSLPLHHACHAEAVLCSPVFKYISSAVLDQLPALRFVVTSSVGLDHIDLNECRRRGISVSNVPSSLFSAAVADLAVGLLIDVLRKVSASDRFVRNGLWPALPGVHLYPLGSKLGGKQVGIVGLGNIGLEVAKRLEAFGCIISYLARKRKPSVSYQFYADVCELAANNDVLIICCALNDQTRHLINKEVLLRLGNRGVIVNVARGSIIDEKEMVEFLQQGRIAGVGLDVFEDEPHVPEELFAMDNVVVTPHCAVFTEETNGDLFELLCGNLEAFFSGRPLLSPVMET